MKNLSKDTAEIRRKAPKSIGGRKAGFARSQCPEKHPGTQGWLRQVAMPGEASGDARLPSAAGDFEPVC